MAWRRSGVQISSGPPSMLYQLFLYYIAGIVQDFLLTLNWRFVAKERPILATIFSFSTTVVSLLVLYNILTQLDRERSLIGILIYSLGIATGTFLGVKLKLKENETIINKLLSVFKKK